MRRYNKLSRHIREIADKLKDIDGKDPWRAEMTNMLLNKLYVGASLTSLLGIILAWFQQGHH